MDHHDQGESCRTWRVEETMGRGEDLKTGGKKETYWRLDQERREHEKAWGGKKKRGEWEVEEMGRAYASKTWYPSFYIWDWSLWLPH